MEEKSEITLSYFLMGFACIVISSSLKAFILHHFINALIVSFGLFIMSIFLVQIGNRIRNNLYVERNAAISGVIGSHQVNDPTNAKLM